MKDWEDLNANEGKAALMGISRRDIALGLYDLVKLQSLAAMYELNTDPIVKAHLLSLSGSFDKKKKRVK